MFNCVFYALFYYYEYVLLAVSEEGGTGLFHAVSVALAAITFLPFLIQLQSGNELKESILNNSIYAKKGINNSFKINTLFNDPILPKGKYSQIFTNAFMKYN